METTRLQALRFPPQASGLIPPVHLILLCALSLAAIAWGAVLVIGSDSLQLESFLIVAGLYGTASAVFVGSRMRWGHFRFFDIPTFVTILAFVEFGLAPLGSFLNSDQLDRSFHGDYEPLTRALVCVALGMMAFWAGSHVAALRRCGPSRVGPNTAMALTAPINSPVICAAVLYSGAFLLKAYFLQNFGLGYGTSQQTYFDHLAGMQVAGVIFQLGTCALVILAIERSFHPFSLERKVIFWVVFVVECVWGLLSGMKATLLQNFFLVAVVSSTGGRKLKRGWVIGALLAFVVVYPFSIQYRELLRDPGSPTGFGATERATGLALQGATQTNSTLIDWLGAGADAALSRFNLLQSVALVMSLRSRGGLLEGDERWWMLPFYPFIPRFIWHSKPILDKGRRFSVALGYGDQTSTAVTYPGDLYFEYGLPGLLVGMFLFGMVAQWLTDRFNVAGNKRRLFIYAGVFTTVLFLLEVDAFYFWSGLIRSIVTVSIVALVVYRDRRRVPLGSRRQ